MSENRAEERVESDVATPITANEPKSGENLIRLIMPSVGDMQLVSQDGGVLMFKPVYFGGECAGPIVQRVTAWSDGTEEITSSFRLKIRSNGELKLAKAD